MLQEKTADAKKRKFREWSSKINSWRSSMPKDPDFVDESNTEQIYNAASIGATRTQPIVMQDLYKSLPAPEQLTPEEIDERFDMRWVVLQEQQRVDE